MKDDLNTIIKRSGKDVLSNEVKLAILKLNQDNLPALGSLDSVDVVSELYKMSNCFFLMFNNKELIAFLVLMDENSNYQSPNYRYFKSNYKQFSYIDRVAVSSNYQRLGIGTVLYRQINEVMGNKTICCEVNTFPMNENSFDFHKKLQFSILEERPFGNKRVAMMVK